MRVHSFDLPRPIDPSRARVLPAMQFAVLKYFLGVARIGSIREAAACLFVSPSALSRQISGLEDDLGVALFERTTDGMCLTAAGKSFAESSSVIIREFEQARQHLHALQGKAAHAVTLACEDYAVASVAMPAIGNAQQRHAQLQVRLLRADHASALSRLMDKECELALLFEPPADAAIRCVARRKIALVAALPATRHARNAGGIDAAQLRRGEHCVLHGFERYLQASAPEATQTALAAAAGQSVDALLAYVQAGLGVGVLPDLSPAGRGSVDGLTFAPLLPTASVSLVLCARADSVLNEGAQALCAQFQLTMETQALPGWHQAAHAGALVQAA